MGCCPGRRRPAPAPPAASQECHPVAAAGLAQPPLRALHFLPPGWPHHLTQVGDGGGGRACCLGAESVLSTCDSWRLPQPVLLLYGASPASTVRRTQPTTSLSSSPPLVAPIQIYPLPLPAIESDEEALLPRRKALHRMLGLPLNRPLLRVANACDFDGAGSGAALAAALAAGGTGGRPRLGDVHVGLPPPPVKGSVHVVQGSYDYYHYMQVITG